MRHNLSVGDRFPLSWKCEDEKDAKGRQVKARTVGRRVWGKDIACPIWLLEVREGQLCLIALDDGGYVAQRFSPPEGYDSPWHSECVSHAMQVAEWHEARMFNASLDLLAFGDPPASETARKALEGN